MTIVPKNVLKTKEKEKLSQKIKDLTKEGFTRVEIADLLSVDWQIVSRIINRPDNFFMSYDRAKLLNTRLNELFPKK